MAEPVLPFRAEYAKSGRAKCKTCARPIAEQTLRIARVVKSRHFDGYEPQWSHAKCDKRIF